MKCHYTSIRMTKNKKWQVRGQLELPYSAGGTVKWCNFGKQFGNFL